MNWQRACIRCHLSLELLTLCCKLIRNYPDWYAASLILIIAFAMPGKAASCKGQGEEDSGGKESRLSWKSKGFWSEGQETKGDCLRHGKSSDFHLKFLLLRQCKLVRSIALWRHHNTQYHIPADCWHTMAKHLDIDDCLAEGSNL